LGDYWKYRVGDYRIIADIQDGKLIILVVRVGNRREVYRWRLRVQRNSRVPIAEPRGIPIWSLHGYREMGNLPTRCGPPPEEGFTQSVKYSPLFRHHLVLQTHATDCM
jgi:hypothetical protein